jgi:hypothetical protein
VVAHNAPAAILITRQRSRFGRQCGNGGRTPLKYPNRLPAVITAILLAATFSVRAGQAGNSASLDGLKTLVGDWTATDADGSPFTASFRLISNNTALEETVNSAHDTQMVSIYNADGPRVSMTHFCSMGNQPRLETPSERPNPNEFVFSFIGATNLASPNDQHMHRMVITMEGLDRFTEAWTIRVNGKDSVREFHYTRKK